MIIAKRQEGGDAKNRILLTRPAAVPYYRQVLAVPHEKPFMHARAGTGEQEIGRGESAEIALEPVSTGVYRAVLITIGGKRVFDALKDQRFVIMGDKDGAPPGRLQRRDEYSMIPAGIAPDRRG